MKPITFSLLIGASALSNATVLTFDISGNTAGQLVQQAYGDNVTAATMGSFSYGSAHGFTPDVTTSYIGLGNQTDLNWWSTGYSDLTNVVEYEPDGDPGYAISLGASTGNLVSLHDFDLGNFGAQITIPGLTVKDGTNNVLFSQSNFVLPGSGTMTHLHFDFNSAPLTAQSLTITLDLSGLGGNSDNVGIDNIGFSQSAVPEPATLAALGIGALALLKRRRK